MVSCVIRENTEGGLSNQGWKDSYDSVFHADGRLAEGSIALVEVQAYVVAAKRSIAKVADRLGDEHLARDLLSQSNRLASKIEEMSGAKNSAITALRLTGQATSAAFQTSTRVTCCSRVQRQSRVRDAWRPHCCLRAFSRMGNSNSCGRREPL